MVMIWCICWGGDTANRQKHFTPLGLNAGGAAWCGHVTWHQADRESCGPGKREEHSLVRPVSRASVACLGQGTDCYSCPCGGFAASKPHRVKTSHDGLAAANSRRQLEEHHALGSYVACRGVLPRRARTAEAVLDQDTAASAEYGPMAKSEASGGSTAKLKFLHGSSVLGVTSREGRSISKELQQEHDSRRDKGDQLVRLLEPEAPNKGSGEGGESEASRLPESWAPRGTSQGCKGEASHSRRNISESFQWLSLAFARRNSSDCPDRGSIKTIKFLGKRWTVGGSRKSSQEELQVERPARSVSDHSSAGSKRAVSWNFMGGARTSLSSSTAALHPSINIPEEPTHSRKSAASKSLGNILSMATMDDKELRPRPLGYAGGTAQAYQGTPPEPGCSPAGATEMRSTPETSEAAALCARAAGLPSSPGSEGPTNSQWQTIPERYATTVEHPSPPEPSSKDDQKPDDLVRTSSTMSKTAALEGSTSCTLGSLRDVGANCQTHATPGSRRFSVAGHETVMNFFPSQQPTLHTILNNLVGGHKSGDKRKSPAPVPKPERVRVCSLDGCMADFPSPPFPDTTQMTYWGSPPSSTGVPFTPPRPASVEDLVELVETESMFAVAEESSSGGDEEVSEDSEESETLLFHQQQGHAVLLRK